MQSGNLLVGHILESKDITNPKNQSQRLSDSEIKNKLVELQQPLFDDGNRDCYLGPTLRSNNIWANGLLAMYIGGARLMYSSNNSASEIGFNILLFGMGSLAFGISVAFKHSTKLRAFIGNHLSESIHYLPYNFKVTELNQILNSLGFESVELKTNYSMKEITILKQKINTVIEETDPLKGKTLGKEVISSALGHMGFFPYPGKIVLDYLIPNTEVVNELIAHPVPTQWR